MAKTEDARINEYMMQGTITVAEILKELGELGVIPYNVRTGLDQRSISYDSLWRPCVGVLAASNEDCHHLFTIAAMAGWNAEYDIKGRGVILRRLTSDAEGTLGAWAILLNAARIVMGEIGST
ncbi:MAG: hypothetical protein ACW98Y_14540 [Candidatus Thorarchaeota archaeon]